jgi:hypothetical protein
MLQSSNCGNIPFILNHPSPVKSHKARQVSTLVYPCLLSRSKYIIEEMGEGNVGRLTKNTTTQGDKSHQR